MQDSCIMLDRIMTLLLSFFGDLARYKEMYQYMGAKLTKGRAVMVNFKC